MVRALACHARGRGFEPHAGRHYASVAQSVEQRTENPRVVGSIPTGSTTFADLAHLVERHLAMVEVASSSLVVRSIILFKRPEIGNFRGATSSRPQVDSQPVVLFLSPGGCKRFVAALTPNCNEKNEKNPCIFPTGIV